MEHLNDALAAGVVAPGNDGTSPSDAKRWATLQARCALVGLAVTRSQDDAGRTVYIASKWALTRQCASLDEVEKLLRSIGGPAV